MAGLVEWGGRALIPLLYKDGEGDGIPHSFVIHLLPLWLLSSICHGERGRRPFDGGGEGRCSTARPSIPRPCGGGARHERKGDGARPRSPWRSGKRGTGRRTGLASASGASSAG